MKDYGNLSVRSAKEQLQAIYGAKNFLRGSQEEEPHKYGHYQKQIDELTQEEDELNSWLGENGDYGKDYDFDGGYDDAVVQEDLAHFNDDLYEGRAENYKPVIDNSKSSSYNQNGGTNSADDEITRKIYESWYEDEEPGYPSPAPDSKDQAPLTGRIDTDPDSGAGMWYAPDGSGTSIDDFQAADNEDDSDKVDSKTAWEIISDWVKADDGDINNGSIYTDPESGKSFYFSPGGERTPLSVLGVDDSTVLNALKKGSVSGGSSNAALQDNAAKKDTANANPSDGRTAGSATAITGSLDSGNSGLKVKSLAMRTMDSNGGISNTLNNSFDYNGGIVRYSNTDSDSAQVADDPLSANAAYTEENKAKFNAIYEENLREIQALEAHKRQASLGTEGANILAPYIDMRLSMRYNQNRRIDEWRNAEKKSAEGSDIGESNQQSANTGAAGTGFGGQSSGGGGGRNGDTDSDLGVLSAKYESNGDPGIISNTPGDPGGKSYGAYQLASDRGAVGEFLDWLKENNGEYYQKLIGAKQDDGDTYGTSFDKAWQQLAEADPSGFFNLQHSYIKYAYYDPIAERLKNEYGFDISTKSKALKNVFWSTAVQHGYYAIAIFVDAGLSGSDEQIINGVYDERKLYLNGCSEQVKRNVINRYESEIKDALNMLKGQ